MYNINIREKNDASLMVARNLPTFIFGENISKPK